MKYYLPALFMLIAFVAAAVSKPILLKSPDGKIVVSIETDKQLLYSVTVNGVQIIAPSAVAMTLNNGMVAGKAMQGVKTKFSTMDETLTPVVRVKNATVRNHYNQVEISTRQNYSVIFRVYDDGLAWRFVTRFDKPVRVLDEKASFVFSGDYGTWFPEEESMMSHNEREYLRLKLSEIGPERFCSTPMLVAVGNGPKVWISEADLEDYPGLWLNGGVKGEHALYGKFAHFPVQVEQKNDRDVAVAESADYLAETRGSRTFPWRVLIIAQNDAQLLESEMVYKLARPCELSDTGWIKPGKVAWDWWNALNLYGVDFKSGVNTATYKYYIDFAAKNGLEYIILDEGWYDLQDIMKVVPEIDMEELLVYAKQKNVGIILWMTWKALDDKMAEAMARFEQWGVKGIKVDFMQRDDQWMVNFYYRCARMAAKHKLLVDYHGAYKPTGLIRTLPNVVTSEGVKGLENLKWSRLPDPQHNVTLPFTRMVAGPMDYTPGAMVNKDSASFYIDFTEPMSMGTRCHQLALYVVFESPLQMLADVPSNYEREPECMRFLSQAPSVWDETRVLKAAVGDYVVMARRSGAAWYIGALTDWTGRDLDISLNFLAPGNHSMQVWQDGPNVDKRAVDFQCLQQTVTAESRVKMRLAGGGGWVAIIR